MNVWRAGSVAASCWVLGLGLALADEKVVTDFGKRSPTAAEIVDALMPSPAQADSAVVTRSLRRDVPVATARKAVNLELTFDYNSAMLTEEAKRQLDPVGNALNFDKLSSVHFLIEGHTDGRGSAAYNQALSERRAEAVRKYLVLQFNVAPSRLRSHGKGMTELKDETNPTSPINRRVEIVTATNY